MRRWPVEVPVLGPEDICRGALSRSNGTHCLLGWKCKVFGYVGNVQRKVVDEIFEVSGRPPSIPFFNDDRRNSKDELAKVWNQAMANLGYTVGNPEKARKK